MPRCACIRRSRHRSGSAILGTSTLPRSPERPRKQRRLFGRGAEHGKGTVDLAGELLRCLADKLAAQVGAVLVLERLRVAVHQRTIRDRLQPFWLAGKAEE